MLNQQVLENAKNLINNNKLQDAEKILSDLNDKYSVFELARIRKIQGRYREAEKLYLKSLSMRSDIKSYIDSDINIELGRIYGRFGKIEEAKQSYEKGTDRISLENNIYREMGEIYLKDRSGTTYYKEAEECFEKAIKLFPNDIKTNLYLAIVYRILNKDSQASKIFNKLLAEKEVKSNKFLYNQVLNQYEILMRKEYLESKPREIRVTITNKCNIGCRYCDIWKVPNWELPKNRMNEIIESFPYLEAIQWLGGETFLYKGFDEILEEGAKYDTLHQTILTNGLLLNENLLEKIAKANISLLIAIDAAKKETYEYLRRGSSWDKLCKNLELIKEVNKKTNKKIYTIFNAVISKSNYKEMLDMVEMANKYDFSEIRFMSILGDSDENMILQQNMEILNYIGNTFPLVVQRAKEYNIKMNGKGKNDFTDIIDVNVNFVKNKQYSHMMKNENGLMECVHPWKQVIIDSRGPMRMCVNSNDWLADSTNQSIHDFWNCEGMQYYRKKFGELYSCAGLLTFYAGPNDLARTCTGNCSQCVITTSPMSCCY